MFFLSAAWGWYPKGSTKDARSREDIFVQAEVSRRAVSSTVDALPGSEFKCLGRFPFLFSGLVLKQV